MSVVQPPAYPGQLVQPAQPAQQSMVLGPIAPPTQDQQHRDRKCSKGLKITGWLQFSMGVVAVVLGIVAIIIQAWQSYFATPIWMGLVLFNTTGALGIMASSRKTQCLRVAYLVMSILSSVFAFSLVITCLVFVSHENTERHDYSNYNYHYYRSHICNPGYYPQIHYNCPHKVGGRQAVDGLLALAALIEGVTAIIGAAYCCRALNAGNCCCCLPSMQGPQTTAYYTNTGTVMYPGGQPTGQVYVQVPQTTYVMAQGPGVPMGSQGAPMYVVQPSNPTGGQPQVPAQYGVPPQQLPPGHTQNFSYPPMAMQAPMQQGPPTYAAPVQSATAPEEAMALPAKGM